MQCAFLDYIIYTNCMKTTKEKLIRLVITYFIAMLYPLYKWISSKSLVKVSDACIIMGMIVTAFGLINGLGRLGAFDASIFLIKKNFQNYNKTYDVYLEDIKEKKKGSFNYPLYLGILLIITAVVTFLFC